MGRGTTRSYIDLAIHAVATLHKNRVATLVCCGGGMSRSPVIAAAALSAVEQLPLEARSRIVTDFYPADILPGFWDEVRYAVEEDRGE